MENIKETPEERWSWMEIVAVEVAIACAALILLNRFFALDEHETLYAAWLTYAGKIPYADFYNIHTPLGFWFFAPLFLFFKNCNVFYAARCLALLVAIVNGVLTAKIAADVFGRRAAAAAFILYLSSWTFLHRAGEIRPDSLMIVFANLATLCLLKGEKDSPKYFLMAGVLAALSAITKQTGFIFAIGVVVFLLIRKKPRPIGYFVSGFLIPWILFLSFLKATGAFHPFIQEAVSNDFLRAALMQKVQSHHWPPAYKEWVFNHFYLCLGAAAGVVLWFSRRTEWMLLAVLWVASGALLMQILHPWPHEFLLLSEYTAILAAGAWAYKPQKKIWLLVGTLVLVVWRLQQALPLIKDGRPQQQTFVQEQNDLLDRTVEGDMFLSVLRPVPFRPSSYYFCVSSLILESPALIEQVGKTWENDLDTKNVKVIFPLGDRVAAAFPNLQKKIDQSYVLTYEDFYVRRNKPDQSAK